MQKQAAETRAIGELTGVRDDVGSVLEGIREGIERTTRIVADLRTFSRLDRAEILAIDVKEALESTLNLLQYRLRGIEVVREYGEVPQLLCLAGQLNQVFMNLLTNAIDAAGPGGRIVVRTRSVDAERLAVDAEDSGSGISASQKIVERHGGAIEVATSEGARSRFSVVLPLSGPSGA